MSEYSEMAEILFDISQNITDDQYVKLCNLLKKIKDKNEDKKYSEDSDSDIIYNNNIYINNLYLPNNYIIQENISIISRNRIE